MLNLIVFLAACLGLICGWITAELTHDHVLSAVVGVVVALLALFSLTWWYDTARAKAWRSPEGEA